MIRFTLRQLEYFVAVGEAGSITVAAGRVNVSSPSISTAISQLETEFGMPLFVRQHAQGLSLTQAGRALMDQARAVLREADRLVDLAGDISGQVRGPIMVGCMLAYDLVVPPDLSFIPLIEMPPFVLISADQPLADRDEIEVEELRSLPMVLLDLPQSADYFLSFFQDKGIKPEISERSRDIAVVRSFVDFAQSWVRDGFSPGGVPLEVSGPLASPAVAETAKTTPPES